jgi:hypothetical protein
MSARACPKARSDAANGSCTGTVTVLNSAHPARVRRDVCGAPTPIASQTAWFGRSPTASSDHAGSTKPDGTPVSQGSSRTNPRASTYLNLIGRAASSTKAEGASTGLRPGGRTDHEGPRGRGRLAGRRGPQGLERGDCSNRTLSTGPRPRAHGAAQGRICFSPRAWTTWTRAEVSASSLNQTDVAPVRRGDAIIGG